MSGVEDLVRWLRAQLDEDETTARRATVRQAGGGAWTYDGSDVQAESGLGVARRVVPVHGEHIARHDPARVLREIDAKRGILECHESWAAGNGDIICGRCGREHIDGRPGGHFPCQTLRLLALPYADRPGYREEWRP